MSFNSLCLCPPKPLCQAELQSIRKNRFENRLLPSRYLWVRLDCFKEKAVWIEWSAWGGMGRGTKISDPTHDAPRAFIQPSIQSSLPQNT